MLNNPDPSGKVAAAETGRLHDHPQKGSPRLFPAAAFRP